MNGPLAYQPAYPPGWPPTARPKRRAVWIIPAVIVSAVMAAATLIFVTWQVIHESPYERCHRIMYEYHVGLFEEINAAVGGDGDVDKIRATAKQDATMTCDYLRARDRLGEVDEESALYLWMEAETGVRLPAGDRSS